MHDLPLILAFLIILAALIGLAPAECPDANCRSVHKQHREREAEAKALSLHRGNHKFYYSDLCRFCREQKDGGYK